MKSVGQIQRDAFHLFEGNLINVDYFPPLLAKS